MYCKDCAYYIEQKYHDFILHFCDCPKLAEDNYRINESDKIDMLIYSYEEGGIFKPGPMFGCIHFKEKAP